jgi:hypothetical protein
MFASHGDKRRREVSTPCYRGVYRTAYFLGSASRRVLDLILFPYRTIVNKKPRRTQEIPLYLPPAP